MNTREINITQALTYPFLLRNWINTLLLPGLLLCSVWAVGNIELDNSELNIPVQWCCVLLVLAIPIGYAWRLIHILQTNGYDTVAPDWTAEKTFIALLDGLKIILLITIIAFVILQPDSLGPLRYLWLTNTLTAPTPITPNAPTQGFGSLTAEDIQTLNALKDPIPNQQAQNTSTQDPEVEAAYAKAMQIKPSAPVQDPEVAAIFARAKAAYPEAQPTPTQQQIPLVINYIRIAVSIAFAPFFLMAIAQSAETRSFRSLCSIRRTLQVGVKGYGKSFTGAFNLRVDTFVCVLFSSESRSKGIFIFLFCIGLHYHDQLSPVSTIR